MTKSDEQAVIRVAKWVGWSVRKDDFDCIRLNEGFVESSNTQKLLMLAVLRKEQWDFRAYPDDRVLFHGEFYSWDDLPLAIIWEADRRIKG